MKHYLKIGDIQSFINNYYYQNKAKLDFPTVTKKMIDLGLGDKEPELLDYNKIVDLPDDEFWKKLDNFSIAVGENYTSDNGKVSESILFPEPRDVFIIHNFFNIKNTIHVHNFFEIDYVYDGECEFIFENERHTLKKGDMTIIAPFSNHSVSTKHENDKFIYILIRKSTFQTSFFSLLSNRDSFSTFFRMIFNESAKPNYLLVSMEPSKMISRLMRMLICENYRDDVYSNNNCISIVNLMFAHTLRHKGSNIEFYHFDNSSNCSDILVYIQKHYHNLTLEDLALKFNYSVPYLSAFIKKNLGLGFAEMIRNMKMVEAEEYLTNTNMSISKISEIIGYTSPDNFTRVFRSTHGISPIAYRNTKK